MSATMIGIIITALAIQIDKLTLYKYFGFPLMALAGVITVITSLVI